MIVKHTNKLSVVSKKDEIKNSQCFRNIKYILGIVEDQHLHFFKYY